MATKKKVSLVKAEGAAFTEALNAASIEELQRALRYRGLTAAKRGRIDAALVARVHPKAQSAAGEPPRGPAAREEALKAGLKAVADKKAKRPSGLDAAAMVLAEAGKPMNCGDMVRRMLETGLWQTGGKTPSSTIYAAIITEISKKGAASRFRKTDRGMFELTEVGKGGK